MRVVRGALANLRRSPSHAAELVSQLVLGEHARVLAEREGWLHVAGEDGYPGWVDELSLNSPDGSRGSPPGRALVWTRRAGTLREQRDPASEPLCDLVLGARLGAGPAGSAVLPGGGRGWAEDGWMDLDELERRFPRAPEAVVRTALGLRGVPYLWGGTTSKAFDCSGFVQRVYALHGIRLPRDAYQQAEIGEVIDAGPAGHGLGAAHLVFFAERGSRVSHVGLALGQAGRFVHSSTAQAGVAVDSLDPADRLYAPRLAARLSGCRRVLPEAAPPA
ncbi:MAG: C40 family peptidase [Gemmatimonadetes bacterium]|nr:C40 family peptidase [Gemmatimonadota bacterium]